MVRTLRIVVLISVGTSAGAPAALAQDKGCDINPSSYATVVPPGRGNGAVITAAPQTPCAIIPNGWENSIGPIGVEVTPRERDLETPMRRTVE